MQLLKIGRFRIVFKIGLVLCFEIIIFIAFKRWRSDHDEPRRSDINRIHTETSTLSNSADFGHLKTLAVTRQSELFTTRETSFKQNVKRPPFSPSTATSTSRTANRRNNNTPVPKLNIYDVNLTVRPRVNKETSPSFDVPNDSAVKFILLMSYMRSGSSMTSELLQQSEYTFFMFEPFWGVYGSAHRRPNVVCAQDLSNSCKNPSGFYQSEQGNLMLLEDLFNCRFKHLPIGVLESFAVFYPNTGYNASRSCFPTGVQKYPGSFYRAILKSKVKPVCFDILEDMCQRAKVRLIKTIRLPMSFARNILERIPNLNLVHLLRDPRGMIHSRAVINYVKLKHGSYPFERLCGWIDDDLEEIKQLIPRFSERIILILYDCLVLNPFQISELLYEYLNLEFNQNVVDWITSHMVSHLFMEEEFVKAGNSLNISRSWRSTIGFDTLGMIDRSCETVNKKLGLKKFENVQDLRNMNNSNLIDIKRCLIKK